MLRTVFPTSYMGGRAEKFLYFPNTDSIMSEEPSHGWSFSAVAVNALSVCICVKSCFFRQRNLSVSSCVPEMAFSNCSTDFSLTRVQHFEPDSGQFLANFGALSKSDVEKLAKRFAQIAGLSVDDESETDSEIIGFKYFGIPFFVRQFMKSLRLDEFLDSIGSGMRIKFDLVAAFEVMLAAHLFKSGSRAELSVWDWQQKLFWHPHITGGLDYQHLLRASPIFAGLQRPLEEHLHGRLVDLFSINVDLVFYDLTSTYVEGHGNWSELLTHGDSRDKRFDCKQIVM